MLSPTNRVSWLIPALLSILFLSACGASEPTEETPVVVSETNSEQAADTGEAGFDIYGGTHSDEFTTTSSGLQYVETGPGEGPMPDPGSVVSVHYTGWLEDGTKFDSSVDREEPIQFLLGRGQVIPGWDEGIALLRTGGRARLIIPPDLAYGVQGAGGGRIPPNATLIFDVELVGIRPGAPSAPTAVDEADYETTESGLRFFDLQEGTGATPQPGQQVTVHYTGWLPGGPKFDSSLDRGQPFSFPLGAGQVIRGWDEGVATMKIGGIRQLVIPPDLAYGDQGAGGVIPPGATLIFEVELLQVR